MSEMAGFPAPMNDGQNKQTSQHHEPWVVSAMVLCAVSDAPDIGLGTFVAYGSGLHLEVAIGEFEQYR